MITLEDALRIAQEKGAAYDEEEVALTHSSLLAFARQVEAETIERCARVCDRNVVRAKDWDSSYYDQASEQCGISIRALSSPIEQIAAEPKCPTCKDKKKIGGGVKQWGRDGRETLFYPVRDCPDCATPSSAKEPDKDCTNCHGTGRFLISGREGYFPCSCVVGLQACIAAQKSSSVEGRKCVCHYENATDPDLLAPHEFSPIRGPRASCMHCDHLEGCHEVATPSSAKCVCAIGGGSATCGAGFEGIEGGTCVNRNIDGDLCGHPTACHEPEQVDS